MANQKYKVKPDCRIEHGGKSYASGDELELSPELALFHAANIDVAKEEKANSTKGNLPPKDKDAQ
jgi:hypothetical protein